MINELVWFTAQPAAISDLNSDGYANIKDFLNGLDLKAKKVDWTDLKNNLGAGS